MLLLHPKTPTFGTPDPTSQDLLRKTIQFFESKGKARILEDDHAAVWYADFLKFVAENGVFATHMTPQGSGPKPTAARWDTTRNNDLSEILGFYGLSYWYTWQVSMLGLCPIWMSANAEVKKQAAELLRDGAIFAFGLSEKEHGADLYSSEMTLIPQADGSFIARGRKYYIGNGNEAALVSTFGRIAGADGKLPPKEKSEFVFFVVDSKHPNYHCIQNAVRSQNYVAEFELKDYPVPASAILSRGQTAWDTALNTINVCKFNLGWASIGLATHALYESIHHAAHRRLFDASVTDFTHVRKLFVDAYARLSAMKLFAQRATDYMRSASANDRRYLLFNPMVKMKVTTQGEEVVGLLGDIIAAKGFEKSELFSLISRDVRALPKLEGTVHVNMALIIKFMKNYFFKPARMPEVRQTDGEANDAFLFDQGSTRGLGKIQFHDYRPVFAHATQPNVRVFSKQISAFKRLLAFAGPSRDQTQDMDFLLILGELFTLVAYGELILEKTQSAEPAQISDALLDQIFDCLVRDFSKFALQLYSKTSSTRLQMFLAKRIIRKPVSGHAADARYDAVWNEVYALRDAYKMPK